MISLLDVLNFESIWHDVLAVGRSVMTNIGKQCGTIFSNKCHAFRKLSQALQFGIDANSKVIGVPRVGVLGVSLAKGQNIHAGVENGPEMIRNTLFIKTLQDDLGYTVTDYGDIFAQNSAKETVVKSIRNPEIIGHICERVSLKVQEILRNGDPVITLGGDHSIAIGSVHGHAQVQPDMCLIWVDAHSDINTATTTTSGNMHGMVLSYHLQELEPYRAQLPEFDWIKPSLTAKDVVFVGLRDVQPLERLILEKFGIKIFSMQEIDRMGIHEVVRHALDAINPKRNRPIHVSFGVDAYDTAVAPCTTSPIPGGLTLREGITFAEEIAKTGLLTGLDIVEVNTKLGQPSDQEKTMFAVRQTILAFCGNCRGGNLPLDVKEIPTNTILKDTLITKNPMEFKESNR